MASIRVTHFNRVVHRNILLSTIMSRMLRRDGESARKKNGECLIFLTTSVEKKKKEKKERKKSSESKRVSETSSHRSGQ